MSAAPMSAGCTLTPSIEQVSPRASLSLASTTWGCGLAASGGNWQGHLLAEALGRSEGHVGGLCPGSVLGDVDCVVMCPI